MKYQGAPIHGPIKKSNKECKMKKLVLKLMVATTLCGCSKELTFSLKDTEASTIIMNSGTSQVIEVGSVDKPYTGDPVLKIKVDGKIIIDSSLCSPDVISDYIDQNDNHNVSHSSGFGRHPEPRSFRSEKTWGEGALNIDFLKPADRKTNLPYDEARRQNVSVILQDEKINAIRIVDHRHEPTESMIQIKIGDSPWTDSRMSREECIKLFGTPIKESSYLIE